MLDKCSNPSCGEPFRYLQHGRLFRLEADPKANASRPTKPQYFWLCSSCASKMTLRLDDDARIRALRIPDALQPTESSVDFVPLDRRQGLVLSCLHFLGREPHRNRTPVTRGKLSYAR